jgi:hypothetical protein
MTELTKPVKRETQATEFERSQNRNIIVSVEPVRNNAVIGLRLKGTRQTYRIGVASVYAQAVRLHLQSIEKEAKRISKDEHVPMRTARSRARKELTKELR